MKRPKARIAWVHYTGGVVVRMKGLVPGAFCPRYFIESWNPHDPANRFALYVPESGEPYRTGTLRDCMDHARVHRRRYLHSLTED